MRIDNGAGLSRETRISARNLGALLLAANDSDFQIGIRIVVAAVGHGRNDAPAFSGEAELAGRMHIKTGRLDDVFAIAGFVRSRSGREYVVVAIQNDIDAHRGPGEEAQSALLRWVYHQ